MPRPNTVTNEDLSRWSEIIDNDPLMPKGLAENPIIREVCYAGQWLADKLTELECPGHLVGRIMYTAGQLSFGHPDTWEVHEDLLTRFINGELEFEMDPEDIN
jgi:hypothetical protein